jgi:hypothetical protein
MDAKPQRTISIVRPLDINGVGVIRIDAHGRTTLYTIKEIRCDIGGRGFAIHRIGLGNLFHTRVGQRRDCDCDCLGFLKNSRCRHVLGLLALIREKKL